MTKKAVRDVCKQILAIAEKRAGKTGDIENALYEVLDEIQDGLEFPLPERFRSKDEIVTAQDEFFDKVWYNRHRIYQDRQLNRLEPPCDPQIWKTALAAARRIEKKYRDETLHWDDFEWGMINGKLSALRWVMGSEWDFLDS